MHSRAVDITVNQMSYQVSRLSGGRCEVRVEGVGTGA